MARQGSQITIRCTPEQHDRLKAKAAAANLTLQDYLIREGLKDRRYRDTEASAAFAPLYLELSKLRESLNRLPTMALVQKAIDLCDQARKDAVLYRLACKLEEVSGRES